MQAVPASIIKALARNETEDEDEKPIDLGSYDLTKPSEAQRLTVNLQKHNKITFLNDMVGATPEQCIAVLLQTHSDEVMRSAKGIVGVATQHTYTRRMHMGSEFICHLQPGEYQHDVMCLDTTSYDYATNIGVTVHFADGTSNDEAKDVEVFLTCCRFTVFSTELRIRRTFDGKLIGECDLLKSPNIIPLRHTTWATQSYIRLRECGRVVSQVDLHMCNILSYKLMEEHYFMTPADLPVRVMGGLSMFNRKTFLNSVPSRFRKRYLLPEEAT